MSVLLFFYLPPIVAIIFFVTCVSIIKKIKNDQSTQNHTIAASIMFSYLFFTLIWVIVNA
ncbi:hypothetical protein [Niallia sp. NCCP-28]|uniref:hypothetical protein n=1 Tax=Niallia sp. NCCP-28 TaxID=2934712 RepID=UPI00207FFF40|nr:hypothetical protein [Niallia sp. NCCP-28]GKU82573.1 hypothetical protein NCCP28_19690 [Niallia sp. NCCP-28]